MKLTELPNQDPKSFEFAALKWLVKRFARPTRRLCVGRTEFNSVALTVNDKLIDEAPNILLLCERIQQRGVR